MGGRVGGHWQARVLAPPPSRVGGCRAFCSQRNLCDTITPTAADCQGRVCLAAPLQRRIFHDAQPVFHLPQEPKNVACGAHDPDDVQLLVPADRRATAGAAVPREWGPRAHHDLEIRQSQPVATAILAPRPPNTPRDAPRSGAGRSRGPDQGQSGRWANSRSRPRCNKRCRPPSR